ncbi:hypothetical protein T484DRAFT_1977097, partial [Baffinella frigidus]
MLRYAFIPFIALPAVLSIRSNRPVHLSALQVSGGGAGSFVALGSFVVPGDPGQLPNIPYLPSPDHSSCRERVAAAAVPSSTCLASPHRAAMAAAPHPLPHRVRRCRQLPGRSFLLHVHPTEERRATHCIRDEPACTRSRAAHCCDAHCRAWRRRSYSRRRCSCRARRRWCQAGGRRGTRCRGDSGRWRIISRRWLTRLVAR